MTPDQVKILFEAARTPLLTNEQRDQLQLRNPFECKGPTAELMQAEVSRIAPEQAKAWISESGASMSLAAACKALEGAMNIEATALGVAGLLEELSIDG